MSLPDGTKLTLTVVCCTGLKKLTAEETGCGVARREDAQERYDRAQEELMAAYADAAQAGPDGLAHAQRMVQRANRTLVAAQARLRSTPDGELVETPPNPFVIVTLDEYNGDAPAMLYTKAVRADTSPIWKHTFNEFPLAAHVDYRRELERYEGADSRYSPRALVFSIYHDDALPDCNDYPALDEESWIRPDSPRRSRLLCRASWDFTDIRRRLGRATFERNLDVIDPCNGRKLRNGKLTIRARIVAPQTPVQRMFQSLFCRKDKRQKPDAANMEMPAECCRQSNA